jgi:hypothetical protein
MARGWESKDVESQVESGQAPKGHYGNNTKSPEQLRREQERKDLQLSRIRIDKKISDLN